MGRSYCHAQASLNNEAAIETLRQYLGYYLTHHDLRFDQGVAMAVLQYPDEANNTDHMAALIEPW